VALGRADLTDTALAIWGVFIRIEELIFRENNSVEAKPVVSVPDIQDHFVFPQIEACRRGELMLIGLIVR